MTEEGWHDAINHYNHLVRSFSFIFHYGQAVFEGLKAYKLSRWNHRLFRPEKNIDRLNTSNERLCIPELMKN